MLRGQSEVRQDVKFRPQEETIVNSCITLIYLRDRLRFDVPNKAVQRQCEKSGPLKLGFGDPKLGLVLRSV
jgi:hypothetical protein